MHTVWVRLNAVVFFGLTVLLGLSCLAGLSKYGHSYMYQPSKFIVVVTSSRLVSFHFILFYFIWEREIKRINETGSYYYARFLLLLLVVVVGWGLDEHLFVRCVCVPVMRPINELYVGSFLPFFALF